MKLSFILVKFVVASNAKENRVTSSLKGRNSISTYRDFTEKSVRYVLFWDKISKQKDCVCSAANAERLIFVLRGPLK